jgi:hypothetical protein
VSVRATGGLCVSMANMSKHMMYSLGSSKSFGRLSLQAKVLWAMLIAEVDDQGRFDAEPDAVKWSVCPNVTEITEESVPTLLNEMVEQKMLLVYGGEEPIGQLLNWWAYQSMSYARASKYPAPEGWVDKVRYRQGEKKWIKQHWDCAGGFGPCVCKGSGNDSDTIADGRRDLHSVTLDSVTFSSIFTEVVGVVVNSGVQAEEMDAFMDDIPEDWFRAACKIAVDNNVRRWSYVRAICKRCRDEGVAPGAKHRGHTEDDDPDGFNADAARLQAEREAQYRADHA